MADTGRRVQSNGLNFYVRDQGSGTAVVLLHGFPCDGTMWALQVEALNAAGYRTICPDLRGAGESDRPADVSGYKIPSLVADVKGIMDALRVDKAHIVGHDWGSALAWAFAGLHKELTLSLTAVSVGHPKCFFAGEKFLQQKMASWYMLVFVTCDAGSVLEALLGGRMMAKEESCEQTQQGVGQAIKMLTRPADGNQAPAILSGLNWYRANVKPEAFLGEGFGDDVPSVAVNTLAIAASGDQYLIADNVRNSGQFVDKPATFEFECLDCPNHWLTWEVPDKLNSLILEHIKKNDP